MKHSMCRTYFPTFNCGADVRTLTQVMDLDDFTLFLKLMAGRTGQLLNKSTLSLTAGLAQATIKRWTSILKTSFVITSLPPYHKNYNKRLVKSPKIYFYDTGLACNLLAIQQEKQLLTHHLLGSLFAFFDNLRFFKKLAGKEIATSYLIYGGQQRQIRSEGIEVRPWNELPNPEDFL